MDKLKIGHWIATGLVGAMMLASGGGYLFAHSEVVEVFATLGFPSFVVYPLGIAKIAGVIVLVWKPVKWLTEWAYAGFNFNFFLAASAHLAAGDNEHMGAIAALVLLYTSYATWKYLEKRKTA